VSRLNSDNAKYLVRLLAYLRLHHKYRDRTMVPALAYAENLALIARSLDDEALRTGAIVECGTWRGGMSAGMIEVGGNDRHYHFFDSFEGLPPAQEIDGPAANRWQSETLLRQRSGNCYASLEEFEATIRMTRCPTGIVHVTKGLFENTLPGFNPPSIAILRLDADWYSSTSICLEKLWDSVAVNGLILIDDYYSWDGCSRAVHEFLAKRQAAERLAQMPLSRHAFIVKK
jgi:O-methyltransferase